MGAELKDILNVLGDVVSKMPDTALWILLGVGVFKLIILLSTTGGVVYIGKLLIVKVHDILISKSSKPTIVQYDLNNDLSSNTTPFDILAAYREVMRHKNHEHLSYIQAQHVLFVKEAVSEKIKRERDNA